MIRQLRQPAPFSRSERVWIETTRDNDELRRSLIRAQNEIERLTGFLALLAAPVPFSALADKTFREMGSEFSKRLGIAQQALRGAAVPKPEPTLSEYASDRVFDGVRPLADAAVQKLKDNFERTHGDEVAAPVTNGDRGSAA